MKYIEVLDFWFKELTAEDWFKKSESLDQMMKDRFLSHLKAAEKGELFSWRQSPEGSLAEIILLDQFSRNIYRGRHESFQNDAAALILAQRMIELKLDSSLPLEKKAFVYMPYMHSESLLIHQIAMKLFSIPGLEVNLKYEIEHKEIIKKFGRYPHRNEILGRESTAEEIEFLKTHAGF